MTNEEKRGEARHYVLEAETGSFGGAVADSVIVTGPSSNVVIDQSGAVIARDVPVPTTTKRVISEDQAFERIGAAVKSNLNQLERNIAQARSESGQFFKFSLVFASLGFIVVLVGVALLLGGQTTAGIISTIASLIPEATAALFFTKDKELRGTIERYHQHVLDSQRLLTMIDVAETVKNGEERDFLKRQIIFKALGISDAA
jgi:hypothetical protein